MPCARSFPGNSPLPFPCRAKSPILSGRRISSSNSTESGCNRGRHAHRFRTRFPNNAGQMPCIVKQIFDFKPESSVYREERGAWIVPQVHSIRPVRGMCGNSRLQIGNQTRPENPINAMARIPAVISAMGMPLNALGTSSKSRRSRIPAKSTSARAKPRAVATE
jgi:hypothetical protein